MKKIGAMFSQGKRTLPLFPLSGIVFPGGRMPLKVFEQRYLDLVKTSLAENSSFGLCGIREGGEVGAPALPYEVGTEVRVIEWDMPQTGIFHIVVEGIGRYVARSWKVQPSGLLLAEVEAISAEAACVIPDELRLCVQVLRHILRDSEVNEANFEDAVWVGYRLSEVLPFKPAIRQDLLEMNDTLTRLRILDQFLRQAAK